MQPSGRSHPLIEHQIEQLLLRAHIEREAGIDLIEEYFASESSLDLITRRANHLIEQHADPDLHETILKNLSECIVVKMQKDKRSLTGLFRKILLKLGISLGKNSEISRAEKLIYKSRN